MTPKRRRALREALIQLLVLIALVLIVARLGAWQSGQLADQAAAEMDRRQ